MTKKIKNKPPARVRYEKTHPVRSFRTTKEIDSRLEAAKKKDGKSIADIVKIGLGMLEVKIKKKEEIRQEGSAEGFEEGYEAARVQYEVTYHCAHCRKPISITTEVEKEAAGKYMMEHRWCHKKCPERRG